MEKKLRSTSEDQLPEKLETILDSTVNWWRMLSMRHTSEGGDAAPCPSDGSREVHQMVDLLERLSKGSFFPCSLKHGLWGHRG